MIDSPVSVAVEQLARRLFEQRNKRGGIAAIVDGRDLEMEIVDSSDRWVLVKSESRQFTNFACYPLPELAAAFYDSVSNKEAGPQFHFPGCAYALMVEFDYGNVARLLWLQGGFESGKIQIPEGIDFTGDPLQYYGRFGNKLVIALSDSAREQECAEIVFSHDSEMPGGQGNLKMVVNNLLSHDYTVHRLNWTERTTEVRAIDNLHPYAGIYSRQLDPRAVRIEKQI